MLSVIAIGEKIAVARKIKNLSQAQLAELLAVSPQAVGKWERGESMPDIIAFQKLAMVLGTDLNYFSGDSAAISESMPLSSPGLPEGPDDKPEWNMSGGNWSNADFSGLYGLAERFSGSNIDRCRFVDSEMAGLTLKGNNIRNSDFSRAALRGCHFTGANLDQDLFVGCDFSRSVFYRSNISNCDFRGTDLSGVSAKWSNLKKLNLSGAFLYRTKFEFVQLTEITFSGDIAECSFENSDFARVTFEKAVLRQCFFKNTKLRRAKFVDCQADRLTYAFMMNDRADLADVAILEENK